jgi:hypothetical protein
MNPAREFASRMRVGFPANARSRHPIDAYDRAELIGLPLIRQHFAEVTLRGIPGS